MRRAALLAIVACAACGPVKRPGIPPEHLMLVTIQALRADHVSAFQHDRPTTALPAPDAIEREVERFEGRAMGLDDLAAAGVAFARCYAPSPSTTASLASLMTGLPPLECGVIADGEIVPRDVPTLAQLCRDAGLRTAAFVTRVELDLESSLAQGFDTFESHVDDEATLADARAWLERVAGDGQRTFAWIHLAGPEPPWSGRSSSAELEALLASRRFEPMQYEGPIDGSAQSLQKIARGEIRLDDADRDALARLYDREVARTSIALGRFLAAAFDYTKSNRPSSEAWARTLFVCAGSTGVQLGEDDLVGHAGTLHESVLHVPLILRHPDSLTGERILADVVELSDVVPTLVEWLDLKTPPRVRGRSLLARIDTYIARPFERRTAITALPDRVFSARDEHFHLVWNPFDAKPKDRPAGAGAIPALALYEPDLDRAESRDVSAARPDAVLALQEAVKAWRVAQSAYPPEKKPRRKTESQPQR
jgi:hypothetical protein